MMIRWHRFNIYFGVALTLALACGCNSTAHKKKAALSTLRLHMEMSRDRLGRSQNISVNRSVPVVLTVDKVPFLTETNVKEAKVVEDRGGFAVRIEFDQEGTYLLEQYTVANRERRVAVFCQFPTLPEYALGPGRWLAAPKITGRITDGFLTFTPDATHEEADLLVLGLNHVAADVPHGNVLNW
jgi:preprotein translocase subunit SecD